MCKNYYRCSCSMVTFKEFYHYEPFASPMNQLCIKKIKDTNIISVSYTCVNINLLKVLKLNRYSIILMVTIFQGILCYRSYSNSIKCLAHFLTVVTTMLVFQCLTGLHSLLVILLSCKVWLT